MNDRNLVVAKFGGTSVQSKEAIQNCISLLEEDTSRRIVLVSATSGTTDLLTKVCEISQSGNSDEALSLLTRFLARHMELAQELGVFSQVSAGLNELGEELKTLVHGICYLQDCSAKTRDKVLSLGERSSSLIFSGAWQASTERKVELFDVREVMVTNSRHGAAVPDLAEIEQCVKAGFSKILEAGGVILTQGFLGRSNQGFTTTLGRGGSDYSASLIAEAIEADALEIWTDVDGIASTDPRICESAHPIRELSYEEAAEMATFGAKVLHPTTLWPAIRKSVPVYVGNSQEPGQGTWIRDKVEAEPLVRAIAHRPEQVLVTITTPRMLNVYGFLAKVFETFSRHELSVDLVTTSEISVAVTLDPKSQISDAFLKELQELGEVKTESGLCLLALIGNQITVCNGVAARVFTSLQDVNVRMVCFGASAHNLCFLVSQEEAPNALRKLHSEFLEGSL